MSTSGYRDFTEVEQEAFDKDRCPFCGNESHWLEGPHGGMSVNLKCKHCGTRVNFMGPLGCDLIELGPSVSTYVPRQPMESTAEQTKDRLDLLLKSKRRIWDRLLRKHP